jgi:hypothetical protein
MAFSTSTATLSVSHVDPFDLQQTGVGCELMPLKLENARKAESVGKARKRLTGGSDIAVASAIESVTELLLEEGITT